MDTNQTPDAIQVNYDRIAQKYAENLLDELDGKPLDRDLLARFAKEAPGPVCDLGCGPGQIARFVRQQGGKDVFGIDLSPEMIAQAGKLTPGIPFRTGNMLALDDADNSWGGIVAFYAIVNLPRESVPTAFAEMNRVLRPGGRLLIAFHIGDHMLTTEDMWGEKVSLDFVFFDTQTIKAQLIEAGFVIDEVIEREPYRDKEHPSRRAYIGAHKPEPAGV